MTCGFDLGEEEQAAALAGGWEPELNDRLQVICLRRHRRCTEAIIVSTTTGQYSLYALSGVVSVSLDLLTLLKNADARVDALLHSIDIDFRKQLNKADFP